MDLVVVFFCPCKVTFSLCQPSSVNCAFHTLPPILGSCWCCCGRCWCCLPIVQKGKGLRKEQVATALVFALENEHSHNTHAFKAFFFCHIHFFNNGIYLRQILRSLQCPPNSCRNPVIPVESRGIETRMFCGICRNRMQQNPVVYLFSICLLIILAVTKSDRAPRDSRHTIYGPPRKWLI